MNRWAIFSRPLNADFSGSSLCYQIVVRETENRQLIRFFYSEKLGTDHIKDLNFYQTKTLCVSSVFFVSLWLADFKLTHRRKKNH